MNAQTAPKFFGFAMFVSAALTAVCLAALPGLLGYLIEQKAGYAEFALPIVLSTSLVALLSALAFLAVVLASLGLSSRGTALGLPDGSIRAVIALSLILLFMIVSVFLYASLLKPVTTSANPGSAAAQDVAKQTVTTMATLVVAVAAFYFGSTSVTAAQRSTLGAAAIRLVHPLGAVALPRKEGSRLTDSIRVETTPSGEPLTWEVVGDKGGQLKQVRPGEFEYIRGPGAEDVVLLQFSLARHAGVSAQVRVEVADDVTSATPQTTDAAKAKPAA